ncbi:MAG: hypothetical protein WCT40_02725 [Candidatus Magasanikbacteria bacterium]
MFDDVPVNGQAGAPPSNLPSEPMDMFSGVEKNDPNTSVTGGPDALDAGKLQRKVTPTPMPATAPVAPVSTLPDLNAPTAANASTYTVKGPVLGKIILFVVGAAVLGGLGFGGWWVYNKFLVKTPTANVPANTPAITQPIEQSPSDEVAPTETAPITVDTSTSDTGDTNTSADLSTEANSDKILFGDTVDNDKDGLDNAREQELGTDPENSDTDADGLTDYEEVATWKTDPLKADTDGDTFKDGQEVRAGYNPLGQGKLTVGQIPTASSTK